VSTNSDHCLPTLPDLRLRFLNITGNDNRGRRNPHHTIGVLDLHLLPAFDRLWGCGSDRELSVCSRGEGLRRMTLSRGEGLLRG
jgi:hypothetical protein